MFNQQILVDVAVATTTIFCLIVAVVTTTIFYLVVVVVTTTTCYSLLKQNLTIEIAIFCCKTHRITTNYTFGSCRLCSKSENLCIHFLVKTTTKLSIQFWYIFCSKK